MSGLNRAAQKFIRDYSEKYPSTKVAAQEARDLVSRALEDTGAFVHVVSGRAKDADSLRGKLRRKRYRNPHRQLTDLIGVRVIAYYRDEVDTIVNRLRNEFEINEKKSVDKRQKLGLHDFGYRSIHLIARLKRDQGLNSRFAVLRKGWFEIQVRSILEHAWSEIEHEIVYKSGIKYPDAVKRRFASLAGTLELLDGEFLALRAERDELVDAYQQIYRDKEDDRKVFDVARLLGFLEAARPRGQGWRSLGGFPSGTGVERSCVEALKAVGLGTAASLRFLFRSRKFRYAVETFASSQGIAPSEVSHLAIVVLAIAIKNARIVRSHFPEIIFDPAMGEIVERRIQRN